MAVAAGAICGLLNGLLITALRVVPFIVTLGTMLLIRGAAKGLSDERRIEAIVGNGKGRLPDATRRHVREVADRLGYRPSAAARTLRTGKSGLIGLTVTTYGDEPFTFTEFAYFAEMARAATSAALARGYALVILPATSRHDVWSNVALDGTVVIDPSDQDPVVSELVRQGLTTRRDLYTDEALGCALSHLGLWRECARADRCATAARPYARRRCRWSTCG